LLADEFHSPVHEFTRSPNAPIILFDGVCNLCNSVVQFVIARDPRARFRFAPLQSEAAAARLHQFLAHQSASDSIVLVENDRVYTRSAAALRIARGLRFPWPLAFLFIAVPRPLRDWLYGIVAQHRYHWFGRREACMVPTPELRNRFLSDSPSAPHSTID
jgi:predicted DCC family thiol-disulfide oxidoreductase YuxK